MQTSVCNKGLAGARALPQQRSVRPARQLTVRAELKQVRRRFVRPSGPIMEPSDGPAPGGWAGAARGEATGAGSCGRAIGSRCSDAGIGGAAAPSNATCACSPMHQRSAPPPSATRAPHAARPPGSRTRHACARHARPAPSMHQCRPLGTGVGRLFRAPLGRRSVVEKSALARTDGRAGPPAAPPPPPRIAHPPGCCPQEVKPSDAASSSGQEGAEVYIGFEKGDYEPR
jgi:hypothetical protein